MTESDRVYVEVTENVSVCTWRCPRGQSRVVSDHVWVIYTVSRDGHVGQTGYQDGCGFLWWTVRVVKVCERVRVVDGEGVRGCVSDRSSECESGRLIARDYVMG